MTLEEILNRINQLRSELQWYLPLEESIERDLWVKIRLDWNYHSSNMEGIDLTFQETQQLMLKGGEISGKKIKDCDQVKGHDDAIEEIKCHIKESGEFTEHFIRGLHKVLLKEEYYNPAKTADGKPTQKRVVLGEYKSVPNDVETNDGLFRFASPEETKILMQELVDWCKKEMMDGKNHPLRVASEFHYRFVRIHPFDDGNGRMTRLLSNYILMYFYYPPIIIETNEKHEYISSLRKADDGDMNDFEIFNGKKLITALERYIDAAKGLPVLSPGDLRKRILVFTKKMENNYMRNSKSNKFMVEALTNVYTPLVFETSKHIEDIKQFFVESSWHFFEEPKDGMVPMMPMTWNLQSILKQFIEQAKTSDSFHHFKVMNWLTTLKTKEKDVNVEVAFKIFFRDFDYEIKAYVGEPLESGMLMGSFKKLMEAFARYNDMDFDDDRFSGFEYPVHRGDYGIIILKEDIIKWADTLGHNIVGYMEKRAGFAPKEKKPQAKLPGISNKLND